MTTSMGVLTPQRDMVPLRGTERGELLAGNRSQSRRPVIGAADAFTIVKAPGDIVAAEGNALSATYLAVSLDPWSAGTETSVTVPTDCRPPVSARFGVSLSQRSDGEPVSLVLAGGARSASTAAVAIASVSQATTTLTVDTVTPHGLTPGKRIVIAGVSDSRMNYGAVTVATTPTATQFTVTAGAFGALPSITAGPFTSGTVTPADPLDGFDSAAGILFDNTTATNASLYTRSRGGTPYPSGTLAGSHAITVASTASVQAIAAAATYAFTPTSVFVLSHLVDSVHWLDLPIDSTAVQTARLKRELAVPDPSVTYAARISAERLASVSRPVARIVSATKSGSTTATIVTDAPHGLTTGDQIVIYGNRDQTNFANLTTATAVASVVNATTFTIAYGGSFSGATYGGFVARINGGRALPGIVTMAVQSIARAANIVTVVGNTTWSGIVIGDLVNLSGVRVDLTGADAGVDGAYRVRNIATTTLTLEPITDISTGQIASPTGADIVSTNCGGAVLKRTDVRIHFTTVMERATLEVEPSMSRFDGSAAQQVNIFAGNLNGVTTVSNVTTLAGGSVAEDAATTANPHIVGGVVRTAVSPTTLVAGDAVRDTMSSSGAKVIKPYSVPEASWNASLALTTASAVAIQGAAGAGLRRYITAAQAINTGASPVDLIILDGVTERWRITLPANVLFPIEFPTEIVTTANTALNANLSATGTVRLNAQGYTAP